MHFSHLKRLTPSGMWQLWTRRRCRSWTISFDRFFGNLQLCGDFNLQSGCQLMVRKHFYANEKRTWSGLLTWEYSSNVFLRMETLMGSLGERSFIDPAREDDIVRSWELGIRWRLGVTIDTPEPMCRKLLSMGGKLGVTIEALESRPCEWELFSIDMGICISWSSALSQKVAHWVFAPSGYLSPSTAQTSWVMLSGMMLRETMALARVVSQNNANALQITWLRQWF